MSFSSVAGGANSAPSNPMQFVDLRGYFAAEKESGKRKGGRKKGKRGMDKMAGKRRKHSRN